MSGETPGTSSALGLDQALLEIIICPADHGHLRVDASQAELVCTRCGLAYPVRDGIPVLLVDEARRPEPAESPESSAPSGSPASQD